MSTKQYKNAGLRVKRTILFRDRQKESRRNVVRRKRIAIYESHFIREDTVIDIVDYQNGFISIAQIDFSRYNMNTILIKPLERGGGDIFYEMFTDRNNVFLNDESKCDRMKELFGHLIQSISQHKEFKKIVRYVQNDIHPTLNFFNGGNYFQRNYFIALSDICANSLGWVVLQSNPSDSSSSSTFSMM